MVFVLFILSALITVLAAIRLSRYADTLSKKSMLGASLIGAWLLAGATSLPELTTSVAAIAVNTPDLAVGNVIGSNLFNILIIAFFDIYYRKKRVFVSVSNAYKTSAVAGAVLSLVTTAILIWPLEYQLSIISVQSIAILITYSAAIYMLQRRQPNLSADESELPPFPVSTRRAVYGFTLAALLILLAGSILTYTADEIALTTGLGASFVGSFFVAASTSLPEAVAVLIALQLNNYNLALASILGSNLLNLLFLVFIDALYGPTALYPVLSAAHIVTAVAVTLLSCGLLARMMYAKKTMRSYASWPSILLILLYFICTAIVYYFS
ncbi:sodium:calcium antiporter [Salsuginibacillus kocurii]|uniref:sodium:calcium antiporter n=1 Tax=Salsuginibacillus kocurii TaxID=427078 RepID=UPI00036E13F7|nr:sodium:calcium antiporter [Salsuginibacillus kocurii]